MLWESRPLPIGSNSPGARAWLQAQRLPQDAEQQTVSQSG